MNFEMVTGAHGAVRWWVSAYTWGLPVDLRDRRRLEIESDLWEQQNKLEKGSSSPGNAAIQVLVRFLGGVPADLLWRWDEGRDALLLATNNGRRSGLAVVTGRRGPLWFAVAAAALTLWMIVASPFGQSIGKFVNSGEMHVDRRSHDQVTLPDGRVMVIGGRNTHARPCAECPKASIAIEVYDPVTDEWTLTGSLVDSRLSMVVAAQPDGSVLVAGGTNKSWELVDAAELWDPATDTWTLTGSMTVARQDYAWTVLPDGRVIVIGGLAFADKTFSRLASAELYTPETGEWTEVASMSVERTLHTATTLADGRVLVVGGGKLDGPHLKTAELYDPATDTWTDAGEMSVGRVTHTATTLADGRVLVVGGRGKKTSAEIWDPATSAWTLVAELANQRSEHAAVLLADGRVMVTGGLGVGASAEIYDPELDTWSAAPDMLESRYRHVVTLLGDGRVLITGGQGEGGRWLTETELYVP